MAKILEQPHPIKITFDFFAYRASQYIYLSN